MSTRRPNLLYSPVEYAARVDVDVAMVTSWVRAGMPTFRDWTQRPSTLAIAPLRADFWLKKRGLTEGLVMHPTDCVYFFLRSDERMKVGFTGSLDRRFREFRNEALKDGLTMRLVACMPGDREVERAWLRELEVFSLGGEWFHGDAAEEVLGQIRGAA